MLKIFWTLAIHSTENNCFQYCEWLEYNLCMLYYCMVYLTVRLPCLRLASIDAFLQPEFGQFFVFLHIPKEKDIFIEDTDIHFLSAKGQEKEK